MENLYRAEDAPSDPLELRAYTSRLLGSEPSLVLHGGGNTSLKLRVPDFFGDETDVLYVKGSGWDLAHIEPAGFAPVRLEVLQRLARLPSISDSDLVREQRAALLDPSAPNPSIEAVLHALIPFRYVDHTHADAVVTLSNTPDGEDRLRRLYGERVLVVPYVMPGFTLAKQIAELTENVAWASIEGIVLMHHGLFTFGADALESYARTIALVTSAERELEATGAWAAPEVADEASPLETSPFEALPLETVAAVRRAVSRAALRPMLARLDASAEARAFAARGDAAEIASRGTATPDHVIRIKGFPLALSEAPDVDAAVDGYADAYRAYFSRHADGRQAPLDPAPRWAIWPGQGTLAFGADVAATRVAEDLVRHNVRCAQMAEHLGGWRPVTEAELFAMEHWELEQQKLRSAKADPPWRGRVALVTGAAEGIGRAITERLLREGAAVCALDIRPEVEARFAHAAALGVVADVRDRAAVEAAVGACVRRFGGVDALFTNAGNFPKSAMIEALEDEAWASSLELNLSSHLTVLRAAAPFLRRGLEPAVVVMGSRNALAPGPGAAAYSAAKAALTQLARVAALELAPAGVRVNVLHPDKVFDTALWDDERVADRARSYGLAIEAYKRSNLLGVEVGAADVAAAACALAGPTFRCTTGAQIPIDGGNERVI